MWYVVVGAILIFVFLYWLMSSGENKAIHVGDLYIGDTKAGKKLHLVSVYSNTSGFWKSTTACGVANANLGEKYKPGLECDEKYANMEICKKCFPFRE
jgi:hypothetical protein